ncbi:MAG: VWA domain-containing protein [Vicinamibacterales bacterium]
MSPRPRRRLPRDRHLALALALSAVALGGSTPGAGGAAQDASGQEPRFRGGTNLVRLDVYVARDGVAVTDLTADDFEVLEDTAPQAVTSFELVQPRGGVPDSARVEPNTVAESQARAAQPDARVFVLFLDTLHVQVEGSYRARNPIAALLDRVVGEDDLVGVMTPEISARNITYSPRTTSIDRMLADNWAWGRRGALTTADPREDELRRCYPDVADTAGMADAVIARRRERATLRALDDLLTEVERVRDERTFVLLLTEGWALPGPDERLARVLESSPPPGGPTIGIAPGGRLASDAGQDGGRSLQSCERERALLATTDFGLEFQQMRQRANRANVSFYPIDPRGLVAFDAPIGPGRPPTPTADAAALRRRQDGLRTLAADTDGTVVLNTNIERAMPRLLTDIGAYYLLGYVSTNQKLDGRYRRLTVRVKRPGLDVRSRPGYLAPTTAEFSAGQSAAPSGPSGPPPTVRDALARLPGSRRTRPQVYLQAAGGAGYVQATVELDRAVVAEPEWAQGATVRVEVAPATIASGLPATSGEAITLEAGSRVFAVRHPAREVLPPGQYQVRAEIRAEGVRLPLTLSTVVTVPPADGLLGSAAVASRRGPGTARLFEPTADPRFRRTERLQVETPILDAGATLTARLLNRLGQPMAVPVTLAERLDESLQLRVALAEVSLAPLAMGEYVVEVTATRGDATESVTYAFRIVS